MARNRKESLTCHRHLDMVTQASCRPDIEAHQIVQPVDSGIVIVGQPFTNRGG